VAELHRDVGPDHVLHRRSVRVVARCGRCDSVAFELDDPLDGNTHAVVQLTWKGRMEELPWPRTNLHASLADAEASHQH
jgi:hypothetical protein